MKTIPTVAPKENHITHISYYSTSNSKEKKFSFPTTHLITKPFLPVKTQANLNKKTLVLDLDETLVHSIFTPLQSKQPNITLPIDTEGKTKYIYVYFRPYVNEFLKELSKYFEIVIFTASMRKYAEPLLANLDTNNYCSFKLYREHCSLFNGSVCKDMTRLGRDLKDIIIVDNNPNCYAMHVSNGINIKSWLNDFNDKELQKILPILKFIACNYNDMREGIKTMKDDKGLFSYEKAEKIMNEYSQQSNRNYNNHINNSSFNKLLTKPSTNNATLKTNQHLRVSTAPLNERKKTRFQNKYMQIPYTFKTEVNTPKKLKIETPSTNSVLSRSVGTNNKIKRNHHSNCRTIDYSLDKENISKLVLSNNQINSFRHSSKKSNNFQKPNWIYETKNNLIGEYYTNSTTMPNTFRGKNTFPLKLLYQNNREHKSMVVTKALTNVGNINKSDFNNKKIKEIESKSFVKKENLNAYTNQMNKNSKGKYSINKIKYNLKLQ